MDNPLTESLTICRSIQTIWLGVSLTIIAFAISSDRADKIAARNFLQDLQQQREQLEAASALWLTAEETSEATFYKQTIAIPLEALGKKQGFDVHFESDSLQKLTGDSGARALRQRLEHGRTVADTVKLLEASRTSAQAVTFNAAFFERITSFMTILAAHKTKLAKAEVRIVVEASSGRDSPEQNAKISLYGYAKGTGKIATNVREALDALDPIARQNAQTILDQVLAAGFGRNLSNEYGRTVVPALNGEFIAINGTFVAPFSLAALSDTARMSATAGFHNDQAKLSRSVWNSVSDLTPAQATKKIEDDLANASNTFTFVGITVRESQLAIVGPLALLSFALLFHFHVQNALLLARRATRVARGFPWVSVFEARATLVLNWTIMAIIPFCALVGLSIATWTSLTAGQKTILAVLSIAAVGVCVKATREVLDLRRRILSGARPSLKP